MYHEGNREIQDRFGSTALADRLIEKTHRTAFTASDREFNPRESRQALIRFRQILIDAREAVENEIARGATEDQAAASVLLPQYKTSAVTSSSVRSWCAASIAISHRNDEFIRDDVYG